MMFYGLFIYLIEILDKKFVNKLEKNVIIWTIMLLPRIRESSESPDTSHQNEPGAGDLS